VGVDGKEGGIPKVRSTLVSDIAEIKLTENFGEVVDYIVNDVDDENSDGTIRYLSNSIEQKELELPEAAEIKN